MWIVSFAYWQRKGKKRENNKQNVFMCESRITARHFDWFSESVLISSIVLIWIAQTCKITTFFFLSLWFQLIQFGYQKTRAHRHEKKAKKLIKKHFIPFTIQKCALVFKNTRICACICAQHFIVIVFVVFVLWFSAFDWMSTVFM